MEREREMDGVNESVREAVKGWGTVKIRMEAWGVESETNERGNTCDWILEDIRIKWLMLLGHVKRKKMLIIRGSKHSHTQLNTQTLWGKGKWTV